MSDNQSDKSVALKASAVRLHKNVSEIKDEPHRPEVSYQCESTLPPEEKWHPMFPHETHFCTIHWHLSYSFHRHFDAKGLRRVWSNPSVKINLSTGKNKLQNIRFCFLSKTTSQQWNVHITAEDNNRCCMTLTVFLFFPIERSNPGMTGEVSRVHYTMIKSPMGK